MRKLTGIEAREMRKAHRCPDCRSDVTVDRRTGQVDVHHDDTCPMLARLRRAGRTASLVFIRQPGQSAEDFANEVADTAADLARQTGKAMRIGTDPYRGLLW